MKFEDQCRFKYLLNSARLGQRFIQPQTQP